MKWSALALSWGKPYEPNSVIKNDIEFILMQRKPGGYRAPTVETRLLSLIPASSHKRWFNQIWTDIRGESTRRHPAPFPLELVDRLTRMFSFVGDTVLIPSRAQGPPTWQPPCQDGHPLGLTSTPRTWKWRTRGSARRRRQALPSSRSRFWRRQQSEPRGMMSNQPTFALLRQFEATFRNGPYIHRNSQLGNRIADYLYEDLYALGLSSKFNSRVDARSTS